MLRVNIVFILHITFIKGDKHVLTSNGDCKEKGSFELGTAPGSTSKMLSYSDIRTATGSSGTLNSKDVSGD